MSGDWADHDAVTLPELLLRRLDADPEGPYLDVVGTPLSAADVARDTGALASALRSLGVERGDRVATLLENSPEAVLSWWATVMAGAISVPVNTAFKGAYLTHQLVDSGAEVVVVQADLVARVAAVIGDVPALRHVVVVGEEAVGLARVEVHPWDVLIDSGGSSPAPSGRPGDVATVVYTGGTTGPSKGCMLSHAYHQALATQVAVCWRRTADDVLWNPLPLFHFNALATAVVGSLVTGGSAAIDRRFSVSGFWPELNRTGATIAMLLGSLASLVASAPDRPEMPRSGAPEANRTLRLLPAAPLPPDVDRILQERFGVETFSGGYGVTEASLISWLPPGRENKPGAAGVVNDEWFDVLVVDDEDQPVPAGETGEIVARPRRPHAMFEGYWARPEATAAAIRNLWLHTGDIGRVDEDGYLFFVDRKADYLRRRGENVSSLEVENVLRAHGALSDVAVHAVPSDLAEDDIKATAVLVEGAELTEEELFRWCIDQLPYFALPRYVEFREDLPRSPVGRVLKRDLRDEGVTPQTWDAEAAGIDYERR